MFSSSGQSNHSWTRTRASADQRPRGYISSFSRAMSSFGSPVGISSQESGWSRKLAPTAVQNPDDHETWTLDTPRFDQTVINLHWITVFQAVVNLENAQNCNICTTPVSKMFLGLSPKRHCRESYNPSPGPFLRVQKRMHLLLWYTHRPIHRPFFPGMSHLCPKNFSTAPEKNCYANLQNYFARLTPRTQ